MACWDAAGCPARCGVSWLSSLGVRERAVGADGLVHHGERVGGEHVLAGDCGQQHGVTGPQAAAAAQRGGNREAGRAGTVTMPRGSRRATTMPASAVRVSRSPLAPAQGAGDGPVGDPAGGVDAAEPVHHVPPGRTGSGRRGQGQRTDRSRPGARGAGQAAWGRDDRGDRRGGHGCLPEQSAAAAGREAGSGRARAARPRVQAVSVLGTSHRFWCPRGDLNPHALYGH